MPAKIHLVTSFRLIGLNFTPSPVLYEVDGAQIKKPKDNSDWGVWSLKGGQSKSTDINEHLSSLLDRIDHFAEEIGLLTGGETQVQLRVSIFATFPLDSYASARIEINPEIQMRVSALGASLLLDFYSEEEDE